MGEKFTIKKVFSAGSGSGIAPYIVSVLIIGMTVLMCKPLSNTENYHVVSFILLFVVSIMAMFMGTGPVLLASTLSALVWNYFFIPPQFTFHIDKVEDILLFGVFFCIVLLNGVLTTRIRKQERFVREREERTNALFQLTKELSKAGGIDEVLSVAIKEINNHFSVIPLFILQDGNNMLSFSGRLQKERKLTHDEYSVAEWVFKNKRKAGAFTGNFPVSEYTFYPLPGAKIIPGVVAIKSVQPFTKDKQLFWDTFLAQVSNALEREFLGELAQKARILDESDRLYKTLFNSISHELRIPVATVMGASDSLLNSQHPVNVQSALYHEIFTASLRLNRLIENLLNISRLESGRLTIRLDWYDINDLVNKVLESLKNELKPFNISVSVPENLPLVKIDFGLMEQVLYNLLFNSTQYAPAASLIELSVLHENSTLVIQLTDQGEGFPEESLKLVFEKFYKTKNHKPGGLGLGLSIVKGFVEAHKGWVRVENISPTGSRFTITIPSENPGIINLTMTDE
ncbi:MAG: DUF4118 domain-containing protein [Bacteroidales bacterium]|nr:DUF4118 domain-containing protein [Bacteroidales bacterium]